MRHFLVLCPSEDSDHQEPINETKKQSYSSSILHNLSQQARKQFRDSVRVAPNSQRNKAILHRHVTFQVDTCIGGCTSAAWTMTNRSDDDWGDTDWKTWSQSYRTSERRGSER